MAVNNKGTVTCKDYTQQERFAAIEQFALLGSYTMVKNAIGIPVNTLKHWIEYDGECQAYLQSCRNNITKEHIQGFQRLVTEAQKRVLARLDEGDEQIVKVGDEIRKVKVAVKAKDAAIIAAVATDKSNLLLNKPTSITATDDRLSRIAERLERALTERDAKVVAVVDKDVDNTPGYP